MEMLTVSRFDQLEEQLLYPQPVVGSRPRRVLFFFVFSLLCNAQCKQTDCGLLRKRGQVSARRTSSCGGRDGLKTYSRLCVCVLCVRCISSLCVLGVYLYNVSLNLLHLIPLRLAMIAVITHHA